MNKCKDCLYGDKFKDIITGKIRFRCGIGQEIVLEFGDRELIVDGSCEKYKSSESEATDET